MIVCFLLLLPLAKVLPSFFTRYSDSLSIVFSALPPPRTGNTLRYVLMESPETDFCGYSVPHPYVPKMNVRLQTRVATAAGGELAPNSLSVLKSGLQDMIDMCDVLDSTFDASLARFASKGKGTSKGKGKGKKA